MKLKILVVSLAVLLGAAVAFPVQGAAQTPPGGLRGLRLRCDAASPGYTLFTPLSSDTTYLIDTNGLAVQTWNSGLLPGAWVSLLDNGNLLRGGRDPGKSVFYGGGAGGRFQEFSFDGELLWDFSFSDDRLPHHDAVVLPNGNVLAIVWEARTEEEARRAGRRDGFIPPGGLWPDMLVEFEPQRPNGARIVWEWRIWDHLIQNTDPTLENHGDPALHPERIDINGDIVGLTQPGILHPDLFHTNSIAYNSELDQILLSVPVFNEVWVIDHSTTTQEAASRSGGRSGKGGDLLYRWGNPRTYGRGGPAAQILGFQHDARWIPQGRPGAGNMMVFSNRTPEPQGPATKVYEFVPPVDGLGRYHLPVDGPFGPEAPVWTYSDPSLDASFVSGAERLENGNTFITSGPEGRMFEVTPAGEIVWEYWSPYSGDGNSFTLFRATRISPNHPGLRNRNLRPLDPQPAANALLAMGSSGCAQPQSPVSPTSSMTEPPPTAPASFSQATNQGYIPLIHTFAGGGGSIGDGGPATSATLRFPGGIAVDASGNTYIADTHNHRVRKITPAGIISTVAGDGTEGLTGDGGPATAARLSYPIAIAVDAAGNVYIGDCSNRIRKITPDGIINAFSSSTWTFCIERFYPFSRYYYDGPVTVPGAVFTVDSNGNLFVSETYAHRIRKVTPAGDVSVVAGVGAAGFSGDGGPATSAAINRPSGLALDGAGELYFLDAGSSRIRRVGSDGTISTVVALFNPIAIEFPSGHHFPAGFAIDADGTIYFSNPVSSRVHTMKGGIVELLAGNANGYTGDGSPATLAALSNPTALALDGTGALLIADTNNNRIRSVRYALSTPTVTAIVPNLAGQGGTVDLTLRGTSLISPLSINAGSGITVDNINVVNDISATATLTIAPDAAIGTRALTVTTDLGTSGEVPFSILPPFPDLSITNSHSGALVAGLNGIYLIRVQNNGGVATAGVTTITDELPTGLSFVSGTGTGWSCSASGQTVTCEHPGPLVPGASTALALEVAVGSVLAAVTHSPQVSEPGDLNPLNNTTHAVSTTVVRPVTHFSFSASPAPPSQQMMHLTISTPYPQDVTGTLKMDFKPLTVIPGDDPAVQFINGKREISFVIAAGTLSAQFRCPECGSPSPLFGTRFQEGTVAGTVAFTATLQTGAIQIVGTTNFSISKRGPVISSVRRDETNGPTAVLTLFSNTRDMAQLILRFVTTPKVRLSCGTTPGCFATGDSVIVDVTAAFGSWFTQHTDLGSLSTLRIPFSMEGSVRGTVFVVLRNSAGVSNEVAFSLP